MAAGERELSRVTYTNNLHVFGYGDMVTLDIVNISDPMLPGTERAEKMPNLVAPDLVGEEKVQHDRQITSFHGQKSSTQSYLSAPMQSMSPDTAPSTPIPPSLSSTLGPVLNESPMGSGATLHLVSIPVVPVNNSPNSHKTSVHTSDSNVVSPLEVSRPGVTSATHTMKSAPAVDAMPIPTGWVSSGLRVATAACAHDVPATPVLLFEGNTSGITEIRGAGTVGNPVIIEDDNVITSTLQSTGTGTIIDPIIIDGIKNGCSKKRPIIIYDSDEDGDKKRKKKNNVGNDLCENRSGRPRRLPSRATIKASIASTISIPALNTSVSARLGSAIDRVKSKETTVRNNFVLSRQLSGAADRLLLDYDIASVDIHAYRAHISGGVHAFTTLNTPSTIANPFRRVVFHRAKEWMLEKSNAIIDNCPLSYLELRDHTRSRVQMKEGDRLWNADHPIKVLKPDPSRNHSNRAANNQVYPSLPPGDNRSLFIVASDGVIIGYRFRIPDNLIDTLEQADSLLPQKTKKKGRRGDFAHRHYAVWGLHMRILQLSTELRKDLGKGAEEWLEANSNLFQFVTEKMRVGFPEQYTKTQRFKDDCRKSGYPLPVAGNWHGVAINQRMDNKGGDSHVDWNDSKTIFNCVIPYGRFQDGNIYLPGANVEIEARRTDCFMFFGRVCEHEVLPVTHGQRNVLDLFCHSLTFKRQNEAMATLGVQGRRKGRKVRDSFVRREAAVGKDQARIRRAKRCGG
ncbi:hypothetical protein BJ508DRAFT_333673 [Ascobolus immersus RN42]|uniref:Uncharacterized protein n=1 Tax=Ascobolus immersus RN42 TaxID=1160509 RepID=A0A3N4HPU2_ASCIM|nr:hypothetical protein BJ508DRAFT_333673 [Ascobolus immersus RN42]